MNSPNESISTMECMPWSEKFPDITNTYPSLFVFGSVYCVIFVLGVAGNSMVLYATLCHRALQTVQNLFILNLAAADILICFLSIPVTPVTHIYKEWFFGKNMCHLMPMVQGCSILLCSLTLAAIAVHRYLLIVHPRKPHPSKQSCLLAIAAIWLCSCIIILPYATHMRIRSIPELCGEFCDEAWSSLGLLRTFTAFVFALQFVLPFVLMVYCYTRILYTLRVHIKRKLLRLNCTNAAKFDIVRRKQRRTIILIAMVALFAFAWLPTNVLLILDDYSSVMRGPEATGVRHLLYLIAHTLSMVTVLANPILYAWLNSSFRGVVAQRLHMSKRSAKRLTKLIAGSYESLLVDSTLTSTGKNLNQPLRLLSILSQHLVAKKRCTDVAEERCEQSHSHVSTTSFFQM